MKTVKSVTTQIKALIFLVAMLLIFMAILIIVSVSMHRRNQQEVDELYAKNVAVTLERTITSKFDQADLFIRDIADDYQSGYLTITTLGASIERRFKNQSFADSIVVADTAGNIVYWTGGVLPTNASISDRGYFQYLSANQSDSSIFSSPLKGKFTGNWLIPISRRLQNSDKSFAGVLVAAIKVNRIINMFEQIDVGVNGTISLRDENLLLIARCSRVQGNSGPTGENKMSDQFWSKYRLNNNEGTYTAIAAIDKVERAISYRKVGGTPFLLVVGRSRDDRIQLFIAEFGVPIWLVGLVLLVVIYTIRSLLKLSRAEKIILERTGELLRAKMETDEAKFLADQALDLARCGYWHVNYVEGGEYYNSSDRTAAIFGDPPHNNFKYHIMNDWLVNIAAVDKDFANNTLANYQAAVEGTTPKYDMIHPYRRPLDGKIIWIHVMGKITRLDDGNPKYMYGVAMDITEFKEMEAALVESERKLREAAQHDMNEAQRIAQIGSYVTDIKTGMWVSTETCDKIFGIDKTFNYTIENWNRLVAPESRDELLKYYYKIIEEKGAFYYEYEIIRPNSCERRWVLARGEFIFDDCGNPITLRGTIEDITDKKAIFDELISHRLNLESLVKQRTNELEDAIRSRGYFFACASHDLRQPLQALSLYAHELTLLEGDNIKSLGNKIVATTNSLGRLLTGVLSVSAIDAGEMKVKLIDFDISDIIKRVGSDCATSAAAVNLSVRCIPSALSVYSDPVIVERIVRNLADNACKFTPHGKVLIGARRQADKVKVVVQDTGPGIAGERIPLVLKEFIKGDTPTAGSGLGLSVANRFCDLLGSHLVTKSVVGKGCQFSFELPFSTRGYDPDANCLKSYAFSNDPSDVIIVIDDNVDIATSLANMLNTLEISSLPAYSLEHAIELLADSALIPCGIISDLALGEESGLVAIREIREIFSDRDIPAIILTGDLLAVRNIQANNKLLILEKPADQGKILEALARLHLLALKLQ